MHSAPRIRPKESAYSLSLWLGAALVLAGLLHGSPVKAQTPEKLLLQAITVTPSEGEYFAIYNPNDHAVDLTNYYVTDAIFTNEVYAYIVDAASRTPEKSGGGTFNDFHIRFPAGATIASHDTLAIAHRGATTFAAKYGRKPAFEVVDATTNDTAVPDMVPAFTGSVPATVSSNQLSDAAESLTLYYWDGQSDLVTDVDYVIWGTDARFAVDKSSLSLDGPDADTTPTAYKADTPAASQSPASTASPAAPSGNCLRREDFTEGTQRTSGGNGVGGRDETSENLATTWSTSHAAVPPFVKGPALPRVLTAVPGGPYAGDVNQPINFSGANSVAAEGGTITAYSWNFGDGSAAGTGVTTTHTYATAGSFTVTLTVTGSGGGTHSATTTATVFAPSTGGAQKLVFQAVSVTGNDQEYCAIYNPNGTSVDLSNYYLTDAIFTGEIYAYIVSAANRTPEKAGGGTFNDFHVRFPDGASIASHDTVAVAIRGAAAFGRGYNGRKPAFEISFIDSDDSTVPNMRRAFSNSVPDTASASSQSGLTNGAESLTLYYWDQQSDLVTDVDYICWGPGATSDLRFRVDKTGFSIDGPDADSTPSTYRADTSPATQSAVASAAHTPGNCFRREDFNEGTQKTTGGNGVNGRDETSENLAVTWSSDKSAVPPFVKSGGQTGSLRAVPGGPYTGGVNQAITFNGGGSSAPTGGTISNYAWSFGDGGSGTGATTTHTYTAIGTYTVSLTVTASTGGTHTASTTATITSVAPPPVSTGSLQVKARTFLPSIRERFPITINVASGNQVTLRILDMQGREVMVLFDGDASGSKTYNWDGHDAQLMEVSTGTYICDLEVRGRDGSIHNYQAPIVVASRMERK